MKRKTFLMCPPDYYQCSYIINPYMERNLGKVNHKLAVKQWYDLYRIVLKYADVKLIDPVDGLPDMVFTANAALMIANEQTAWLSKFKKVERQPEEKYFKKWFTQNKFKIIEQPDIIFEGAGDCLIDCNDQYWFGYGQRSSPDAMQRFKELYPNKKAQSLKLITPEFYHLDTCFCPLSMGHFLYYSPAFGYDMDFYNTMIWLGNDPETFIPVFNNEARRFNCNAIDIDGTIITNTISQTLNEYLTDFGYNVIIVDLSEFIKTGGAAKCLTLEI